MNVFYNIAKPHFLIKHVLVKKLSVSFLSKDGNSILVVFVVHANNHLIFIFFYLDEDWVDLSILQAMDKELVTDEVQDEC